MDLIVQQRPTASSSSSSSSSSAGASESNYSSSGGSSSGPAVAGVVLANGERIACRSVVVTTGTFLRGVIHVGSQSRPAGRIASLMSARAASKGEGAVRAAEMTDQADVAAAEAATLLAQRFGELGFQLGRLKTGTPPRLDGEGRLGAAAVIRLLPNLEACWGHTAGCCCHCGCRWRCCTACLCLTVPSRLPFLPLLPRPHD